APLIQGGVPGMVSDLPLTNVIDSTRLFSRTPTENDIGRYVVSFYDSINRIGDPRRTMITVQSGLASLDAAFSSGLKGYWKLGEDFGSTFLDSSGNGNHIAIISPAQNYLARGVSGHRSGQKALHFDNNNQSKIAILFIP